MANLANPPSLPPLPPLPPSLPQTDNLNIPQSCGTCTPGVNCKGRAAGGPKKNEPTKPNKQ